MRATCPDCGAQAHVTAFFVEDDGKRLAGLEPELGRALLSYLGLFKPPKTALRMARAAKIAQEVAELVAVGSVCKDERSGVRRQVSQGQWAAGIEQMLAQRGSLTELRELATDSVLAYDQAAQRLDLIAEQQEHNREET